VIKFNLSSHADMNQHRMFECKLHYLLTLFIKQVNTLWMVDRTDQIIIDASLSINNCIV